MRKSVLLSVALITALSSFAQNQRVSNPGEITLPPPAKMKDIQPATSQKVPHANLRSTGNKALGERILGTTTYDLQTNRTVHDRIARDTAGNMSVVWIASLSSSSTFPDRGAGYSYYNPTSDSWTLSPDYPRVESDRCGWPSILYDANGGEILISHSTASERLKFNYRSKIGDNTVSWSEKNIGSGYFIWNRGAMGGNDGNTIHLIAATDDADSAMYQNLTPAIVYFRSQDAGQTFDITAKILPGLDSGSVGSGDAFDADAYAIVARGNHVAIGVFNGWNDVILLESFDNGTTWTSKVVWDFPYQNYYDFINNHDTTFIENCDGSGTIIIDQNDVVHMAWSRKKIRPSTTTPGSYTYLSFVDSLRYYRNSSPSYTGFAGNWVDANNDSMFLNLGGNYGAQLGIMAYPNLASSGDTLYMVYQGISDTLVSGIDNQTRLFHIWMVKSGDNGLTWSAPLDLTPGDAFAEHAYPDLYPVVDDGRLRLTFQRDAYPSVFLWYNLQTNPSSNFTWQQSISDNDIVYLEITVGGSGIGIGLEKVLDKMGESGVYPNPSNGLVNLSLLLYQDLDVTINVHDINGKVVHTFNGDIQKGRNTIEMNLSHLDPGMYVVNITADGETLTQKVIIE